MPLLRSIYSNPVESAIRAFSDVSGVLERRELSQQRRDLMTEEMADRRIRREREKEQFGWERKKQEEWEKAIGRENATKENIDMLGNLLSADVEEQTAKTEGRDPQYSNKHQEAIFKALGKSHVFDPDKVVEQTDSIRKIQDFMKQNAASLMKGGRLDRDKYPELFESFDKVFQNQVNRGTDKYDQSVEANGVEKKIKSVFIDPKDKSLAFSVDVKTPVKEGQVFKHIGDQTPIYTVNAKAQGMVEQGNIDLSKRPIVRRADGSISTLSSMSFKDEDGKEVLIPMIGSDGKIMTVGESVKEYHKTGKHLGKFESVEDANAYAEVLHSDQMWNADIQAYSAKGKEFTNYEAPLTFDRQGGNPQSQVVKLPIGIFDAYLTSHLSLGSKIQQLQAQLDPKSFAEKIEKTQKQKKENKAISVAFASIKTTKPIEDQRKQFIQKFTELMPEASVKETVELAKTIIQEKEPRSVTEIDVALAAAKGDPKETLRLLREQKPGKEQQFEMKTIYGPKGETKEVSIKKGADYTPPSGWSLKVPKEAKESTAIHTTETDTGLVSLERGPGGRVMSTPIIDSATGKPVQKIRQLTDFQKLQRREKIGAALTDRLKSQLHIDDQKAKKVGDLDLEKRQSEHAGKLSLLADDLMEKDPKISEAKALDMAEKEIGRVPGKTLDEDTAQSYLTVAEKKLGKKPWFMSKQEKQEWNRKIKKMAEKMAVDEGYSVEEEK